MDSSSSDKKEYNEELLAFADSFSRAIRKPLIHMRGYNGLLGAEGFDSLNDNQKDFIQGISAWLKTANKIIEVYKKGAKVESGLLQTNLEPVNLSLAVHEVIKDPHLQAETESKNFSLQLNLPTDLPTVKARTLEVQELLQGLMNDTMIYALPNAQLSISAAPNTNTVKTKIHSSGTQFLSEECAKRYYDDDMNLFVIQQYIEQFGGEFGEESEEGKGSTVWFTLPIANEPAEKE